MKCFFTILSIYCPYPREESHASTSFWASLICELFIVNPSNNVAFGSSSLIVCRISEKPLPPEVENGMIVFPEKSYSSKKTVHRHWKIIPPVWIVKCSPSSPALENTGLNGLHKCVFCSFLVAYCSDLSHLLYSASPVYTNTYV